MDSIPDLISSAGKSDAFHLGGSVVPRELGDTLARLVWESFSDFLVEPTTRTLLADLGVPAPDEGVPDEHSAEELLILHLWAHTRAVQLSFFGRAPEHLVRATLDSLHRAVFDDMVTNGTPPHHLPVFEQRVSARYAEYYEGAEASDERVGEVAAGHVASASERELSNAARALADRAVEVVNPLRDYLDDLELSEA
jgi:hypothetical protein